MRVRHRIPSIFNLSMVDVLCCALGCVILLWLIQLRAARMSEEQSATAQDDSRKQIAAEKKETADLREQRSADAARISKQQAESADLDRKLTASLQENALLEGRIREKHSLAGAAARRADDLAAKLSATGNQFAAAMRETADLKQQKAAAEIQLAAAKKEAIELKEQTAAAEARISKQMSDKSDLDKKLMTAVQREISLADQIRDRDAQIVAAVRRETDLASRLKDSGNQLAAATKETADLKAQKTVAEALISRQLAENSNLDRKLTTSVQRVVFLEGQVRDKDAQAGAAARRESDLAARLTSTERRINDLRPLAELVPGLQAEARTYRDKFAAEEAMARALEKEVGQRSKELADAGRSIELLQGEKKAFAGEAARVRAAAENRFAGIALTGRRVVFLVDMSGSMEMVDERTLAPDKWQGVRETLAKVMRSLPEMEKFQVVMFSEKTSFLLGQDGRWLDYDPRKSVDQVSKALATVKPRGGTNMYAALEAAFRFRSEGLDTLYLFSDGLPNVGEGLTPEVARNLKEFEQSDILAKHIRKTLKTNWNREASGKPRVRINSVGFFYESPDVGAFLWALSRENDGSFVGMSKP